MSTKTARKRVPRAEREAQMLEAAERLFADQGFHATSMDEIAAEVGVTKPMLYEYFGSKEGLLLAGIRRFRAELLQRSIGAVEGAGSAEEMLRRGVRAYLEFMEEKAGAWRMVRHETSVTDGPAAEEVEGIRQQQAEWVAQLLAATAATPPPAVKSRALAELMIGACERIAIWRESHPEVTAEDAAEYVMAFAWTGLEAQSRPLS